MKQWKQVTAAVLAVSMGILLLGGCADNTPALYNDPVTREDDELKTDIISTVDHRKIAFVPASGGTYRKAELHVSFWRNGHMTDRKTVTIEDVDFYDYPVFYVDAPEKWDDVTYEWVLEGETDEYFWTPNSFYINIGEGKVVDGELVASVWEIREVSDETMENLVFTAIFKKGDEFVDIQQGELKSEEREEDWPGFQESIVHFQLPEGGTEAYDKYYIQLLSACKVEIN